MTAVSIRDDAEIVPVVGRGSSLVDVAARFEVADSWMPDLIAWASNPSHVDAEALNERALESIRESFEQCFGDYPDLVTPDELATTIATVQTVLEGVAEWLVAERAAGVAS